VHLLNSQPFRTTDNEVECLGKTRIAHGVERSDDGGVNKGLGILNALLAGNTAEQLQPELAQLSAVEHQALVCTACVLRQEIADTCQAPAYEVNKLVAENCPFHKFGAKDCPRSTLIGFQQLRHT
jgi:hypothetical protein